MVRLVRQKKKKKAFLRCSFSRRWAIREGPAWAWSMGRR